MKNRVHNARTADTSHHATDMMMLEDPLEFLADDHMRSKTVCETMRRVVSAVTPDRSDLLEVQTFLQHELPLLLHDEDDDLCLIMRERALASDDFDKLAQRITILHAEIDTKRLGVLETINVRLNDGMPLTAVDRVELTDLEVKLRKDMIMENARLLPLARLRLTAEDISTLRGLMLRRHIADLAGA